ncbi:MAG: WS/DGAT domain-containing protein [Planctomycetia bacterium]|nr:WS/DGAT domain-containing protein [Planctomycetia bacterium]
MKTETRYPVTQKGIFRFFPISRFFSLPFFSYRRRNSIQIAVPVSLRKAPMDGMPLRNIVSVMFLAEPVKIRKSREDFLRHIHRKMTYFRHHFRAELLLLELKWLCALRLGRDRRWGMRRFISRKTPLATLVVSNLGILLNFSTLPRTEEGKILAGTLCVEEIQLVSPRTTDAALTVAVGTYANRLHFGLHPDPCRLSDEATRRFLALWIEELEALVGR